MEQQKQKRSKNDPRVTRIGKLMRKTSVDEISVFFNVLLDMSVVGPRVLIWSQNLSTAGKKISNSPLCETCTHGLAQVSGLEGN
jgi:lipopolysaccharide/colanic/teichoic acid biosynthesis glycosyltransferase